MTIAIPKDLLDEIHDEMSNYMDDLQDLHPDYSGRAMYGAKCIGWSHDETSERFVMTLLMTVIQVAKENTESDNPLLQLARQEDWWELLNTLSYAKSDSLGRSTITYFPDLVLEES